MTEKTKIDVVYDGDCPFCSRYVKLVRLRENFDVQLVDARQAPTRAKRYRSLGYDLSDGMIAEISGRIHYGPDAISVLSLLSSRSGTWNRVFAVCFRNRAISRLVYPVLRLGRNMTLAAIGRERRI